MPVLLYVIVEPFPCESVDVNGLNAFVPVPYVHDWEDPVALDALVIGPPLAP